MLKSNNEDQLMIRQEVLVPATREELWHAWTTSEGITTFFAPKAHIELKPGGAYELYFLLDNPYGLQGSEDCHVIAFWPMDYITFSWSAPPEFPDKRKERTRVTVEIDRYDQTQYKVALTHVGFGDDEEWRAVHAYFEKAWRRVLDRLRATFLSRAQSSHNNTTSLAENKD